MTRESRVAGRYAPALFASTLISLLTAFPSQSFDPTDDADVFTKELRTSYGSLPKDYVIDIYAHVEGTNVSNIVVLCSPDNPKLEACSRKAALTMPWSEKVSKGVERHFNIQISGDDSWIANGPLCFDQRMLGQEEIFSHGMRVQIGDKWQLPANKYPLTNVFVVGALSDTGKLTQLWTDSAPKSPALEAKLLAILKAPGFIKQTPNTHDGDQRREYPAEFWLNITTENSGKKNFFGATGPFLTKPNDIASSKTAALKDPSYALSKEFIFWLTSLIGREAIYERTSLPVEMVASQKHKSNVAASEASQQAQNKTEFATKNKALYACYMAGTLAAKANNLDPATASLKQSVDLFKTSQEAQSMVVELLNSIVTRLDDAKQYNKAEAIELSTIESMRKRHAFTPAAMAGMCVLHTRTVKQDSEGALSAVNEIKTDLQNAVAQLKPTQREESGSIVGAVLGYSLAIPMELSQCGLAETDENKQKFAAIMGDFQKISKDALAICPVPGLTVTDSSMTIRPDVAPAK